MRICEIKGCDKKHYGRGMCVNHYARFTRTGRPEVNYRTSTKEMFWKKVLIPADKSKCWLWRGAKQNSGYGRFRYKGRCEGAHRIAWLFEHGVLPELYVLHRCDNPSCVNPEHLFLGTCQDNVLDCIAKNRFNRPKGVNHFRSKFTEPDILKIRGLIKQGFNDREISEDFNVCGTTIQAIREGRTWKHIK